MQHSTELNSCQSNKPEDLRSKAFSNVAAHAQITDENLNAKTLGETIAAHGYIELFGKRYAVVSIGIREEIKISASEAQQEAVSESELRHPREVLAKRAVDLLKCIVKFATVSGCLIIYKPQAVV